MGGHWKIMNFYNPTIKSKEIFNKEWSVNRPKAVEAAIMLDMLEFLKELISPQLEG